MLLLLGLLPAALAATLTVPGDYSTVQDAVDAATSGDTISLAGSTFTESVSVGVDLTILGTTGTELEADGVTALVVRSGATVSVASLEITPGDHGVWVRPGASLTLTDVSISGHSTGVSGVGAVVAGELVLDGCDLSSLDAGDGYGAAVYAMSGASVVASSTRFDSDNAQLGGAVWAEDASFTCTDCTFSSNTAVATTVSASGGGAIYATGSGDLSLSSCTLASNEAEVGGAILWAPMATSGTVPALVVSGTTFTENSADDRGGAVFAQGSGSLTFLDTTLLSNTAATAGGLSLSTDDEGELRRVTLCANTATDGDGGGLALSMGDFTLTNLILQENEASVSGGGLWAGEVDVELIQSDLLGNSATAGAGIYGQSTTLSLINDVLGWQAGAAAVETNQAELEISTNVWYGNSVDDIIGDLTWSDLDSSNTADDPELSDYTDDGDCTNDVLWQTLESPLVDAGDLTLPDDPDETRCDIGAYGGPEASAAAYADADGDAWIAMFDCDEEEPTTSPSADEYCDEVDNDCDGDVDEDALDARTWYMDADGDTWGAPDATTLACDRPDDTWIYVFDPGEGMDCDDEDPTIHPGALEHCDGVDEDCDGATDEEAVDAPWWHRDEDGDGYGVFEEAVWACEPPAGWVSSEVYDCDDEDPEVHPGAEEVCDGVDNDCDTSVDGSTATDAVYWYQDADGDGFGDPEVRQLACDRPEGWVRNRRDCDDSDPTVNPDADEIWYDAVDQDCGDDDDFDQDHDGHARIPDGDDCDDTDPGVHPGATELSDDGIDQDCDGEDLTDDDRGCSTAPAGPWWLLLASLSLLTRIRRTLPSPRRSTAPIAAAPAPDRS